MFTKQCFSLSLISQRCISKSTRMFTANKEVIGERVNNTGVITLNRPKQLNALNLDMVREMYKQIKVWETDPSVNLILVQNNRGSNAFCAGGDIKAIRESAVSGDLKNALDFFREEFMLNHAIAVCKKPYIAFMNGITMGGGVGISIHGRYRVATEKTLFAMPETAIGFFPDVGASYPLTRLDGRLGVYLALTGARLKGKEVFDAGIATHYVHSSKAEEFEESLKALQRPNESQLEQLLSKFNTEVRSKYPLERINTAFAPDSVEKILQNLEADKTEWSSKQVATLGKMSPTALKVTLEQFRLASKSSLTQVLELDYRLCQHFIKTNDFAEGVRALLVDKDNKPNWVPKKVEDVTVEMVNRFFKPLDSDDKLTFNSSSSTQSKV